MVVVPGALPEVAVLAAALPCVSEVVGAEDPTVLGLDDRVHATRPRGRRRHSDLSKESFRHTLVAADLRPGVATVVRAEQATALAARDELPGATDRLPERGVDDPRVVGIERDINRAGDIAPVQDLLPGLAAVARAEDAALGVGAMGVTERRDVCGVRVLGVDADLADVAGVFETEVGPGLPGVGRSIDPVTVRHVPADAAFAHSDVDHVRIGLCHGDRADRRALEEPVGRVFPVLATVHGFPDAATGRAEVEGAPLARIARDGCDAATAVWAGRTPLETVEKVADFSRAGSGAARDRAGTTFCWHGTGLPR